MGYRVPDEMHAELVNWSRWCWLGEYPCAGASEPGWMGGRPISEDDDDPEYMAPPNTRRAEAVQAAWSSMDELTRKVLRAEYPARDGKGRPAAAARLGLTLDQYEARLQAAASRLEGVADAVCA